MTVLRRARTYAARLVSSPLALFFILESAFAGAYIVWSWARGFELRLAAQAPELLFGALLAAPLLAANYFIFFSDSGPPALKRECASFLQRVIIPFARTLDPHHAAMLALAAGIGEELFFRGVLQQELGIIFSSALFAVLHFGPAIHKFPFVSVLYFLMSLYLAAVSLISLATAVVTHVTYDFFALIYLLSTSNSKRRAHGSGDARGE